MRYDQLTLIGYFPRDARVPEGWSVSPNVSEICSVSDCVNRSPEGWLQHWLHNDWGFFNSLADARAVLPTESAGFQIFAYRLLPVCFKQGEAKPIQVAGLSIEPLPPTFAPLGFDAVSKSISAFFECSPLSCNGLAAEFPVNPFCLVDDFDAAISFAERCSREEPEPGPYYVLEVLRSGAGSQPAQSELVFPP